MLPKTHFFGLKLGNFVSKNALKNTKVSRNFCSANSDVNLQLVPRTLINNNHINNSFSELLKLKFNFEPKIH